ncbi:MAG: TetR/AcrR family transcriptional regulator [Parvibaculum sp.]
MPKIIDHEQRKRELIEASWAVIAAEGLEGVTMRKIAAAAGCTTGRITHYFADREALILAALYAVNEATSLRIDRILSEKDRPVFDRLIAATHEALPLDATRLLEWKIWIAFWGAATITPALAEENERRQREWLSAITPLIALLNPKADAAYEAERILGLLNGLGLRGAIQPTEQNRGEMITTIERHLGDVAKRPTV